MAQKIKVLKSVTIGGIEKKKGDIVSVSSSLFISLINDGNAEKYVPKKKKED